MKLDKSRVTSMEDRREHSRHDCLEATFYATNNGVYECIIKDKDPRGVKGVFVATSEDIKVGDVITLAVPLSDKKKGRKLKGVIVRKAPSGVGVHFKSILNE
jgi:hypothetical protein